MKLFTILLLLFAGPLTAADFNIGQDAPDFELGAQKWNTPEGDALVRELEKVIAKYPVTPAGKEVSAMKGKAEAPVAGPAKGK